MMEDFDEFLEETSADDIAGEENASGYIIADPAINKLVYTDGLRFSSIVSDYLEIVGAEKNIDSKEVKITFLHKTSYCSEEIEGTLDDLGKNKIFRIFIFKRRCRI